MNPCQDTHQVLEDQRTGDTRHDLMLQAAPDGSFSNAKARNSPWIPRKLFQGENHEESTQKNKIKYSMWSDLLYQMGSNEDAG